MKAQQATWIIMRTGVGREIQKIQRVLYDWEGEVDETDGQVILSFRDGSVLRFFDAAGGERIAVSETTWLPPAVQQGSPGFWKLVDVSASTPFAGLIGLKICTAKPLLNRYGSLSGIHFDVGGIDFSVVAEADECHVLWSRGELDRRQLRIADEEDVE